MSLFNWPSLSPITLIYYYLYRLGENGLTLKQLGSAAYRSRCTEKVCADMRRDDLTSQLLLPHCPIADCLSGVPGSQDLLNNNTIPFIFKIVSIYLIHRCIHLLGQSLALIYSFHPSTFKLIMTYYSNTLMPPYNNEEETVYLVKPILVISINDSRI